MQLLGDGNEIAQLAQFQVHVICIAHEFVLIYSRNVSQPRRHNSGSEHFFDQLLPFIEPLGLRQLVRHLAAYITAVREAFDPGSNFLKKCSDPELFAFVEALLDAGLAAGFVDVVGFFLVQAEHFFDEFEPDEAGHGDGDDPPPGHVGEFPDFEVAQGDQGNKQEDEGHGFPLEQQSSYHCVNQNVYQPLPSVSLLPVQGKQDRICTGIHFGE
jgi:hypothetical protein